MLSGIKDCLEEGMSAVQLGRQGVKESARIVSLSGTHLLGTVFNQISRSKGYEEFNNKSNEN